MHRNENLLRNSRNVWQHLEKVDSVDKRRVGWSWISWYLGLFLTQVFAYWWSWQIQTLFWEAFEGQHWSLSCLEHLHSWVKTHYGLSLWRQQKVGVSVGGACNDWLHFEGRQEGKPQLPPDAHSSQLQNGRLVSRFKDFRPCPLRKRKVSRSDCWIWHGKWRGVYAGDFRIYAINFGSSTRRKCRNAQHALLFPRRWDAWSRYYQHPRRCLAELKTYRARLLAQSFPESTPRGDQERYLRRGMSSV